MLFLRLIKMIIAPLYLPPGRRHRPYGLWRQARPDLRKTMAGSSAPPLSRCWLGLVMVNLLQPGANFPGTC